jgi:hypothetical protein
MSIRAPLMFNIDAGALISPKPTEFMEQGDSLGIPDGFIDAALIMRINNQWGFGASLSVLMAPDSLSIENGEVDTLLSNFTFVPNISITDTIFLDQSAFKLLKNSPSWIQPQIRIISTDDNSVKFLSTDTLKITIDGLSTSIDLSELVGTD